MQISNNYNALVMMNSDNITVKLVNLLTKIEVSGQLDTGIYHT